LIEHALTKKYISQDDVSSLQEWRNQPETWGK